MNAELAALHEERRKRTTGPARQILHIAVPFNQLKSKQASMHALRDQSPELIDVVKTGFKNSLMATHFVFAQEIAVIFDIALFCS